MLRKRGQWVCSDAQMEDAMWQNECHIGDLVFLEGRDYDSHYCSLCWISHQPREFISYKRSTEL